MRTGGPVPVPPLEAGVCVAACRLRRGSRSFHGCPREYEIRFWRDRLLQDGSARFMKEFCYDFFEKLDSNRCVRVTHGPEQQDVAQLEGGSWCYVSQECTQLNGGHKVSDKVIPRETWWQFWKSDTLVPRDVSWKQCVKGKDARFADLTPPELKEFASKGNHMLGHFALQAYPKLFEPQGGNQQLNRWILSDILPAWSKGDLDSLPESLRSAIENKAPIVVNTLRDSHGDQAIIWGDQLITLSMDLIKNEQGTPIALECPDVQHCYKPHKCKFGCGEL